MPKKVAIFWPGDYRAKPNEWALSQSREATSKLVAALKKLGAAKTLPSLIALRLGANAESGYSDEENPYSDDAAKAFLESPLGKQLRSVVVGIEGLDRLPPPERVTLGGGDDDDGDGDDDDDE